MHADVISDGGEQRDLQSVGPLKQRNPRAVALRDFFLLFLAHLMRVAELLEKLVRILDAIYTEVEMVDVLIAGPDARRFACRISAIRRQREIGLTVGDSRRGRLWLCGWRRLVPHGARTNHVEAKSGCDDD